MQPSALRLEYYFVAELNVTANREHDPKKPVTRHDSMPDAMRHKIRIQLSYWPRGLAISDEEGGLGLMEIDYTSPLATLADKRITVSYEPARDVDRQMIASAGGNMENG